MVEHFLSKRLSFVRLKMESKIPLRSWQTVASQKHSSKPPSERAHMTCTAAAVAESMLKTRSEYGRQHLSLWRKVSHTHLPRLLLEQTISLWRATNLQICAQIRCPWSSRKSNFLVFNSKLKKNKKKTAPHPPPCGTFNCQDVMVGDKK